MYKSTTILRVNIYYYMNNKCNPYLLLDFFFFISLVWDVRKYTTHLTSCAPQVPSRHVCGCYFASKVGLGSSLPWIYIFMNRWINFPLWRQHQWKSLFFVGLELALQVGFKRWNLLYKFLWAVRFYSLDESLYCNSLILLHATFNLISSFPFSQIF